MFTIEMDWDETCITVLDDTGKQDDVQVIMYEDICYIRQWDPTVERHDIIALTPGQLEEIQQAWQLPEGAYQMRRKNE
jgi:hypothetical protein